MSNTSSSSSSGIGFCGLLTIVFITLKLTHVIDWSWIWVLSPLWGGLAAMVIITVAVVIFTSLTALIGLLIAIILSNCIIPLMKKFSKKKTRI